MYRLYNYFFRPPPPPRSSTNNMRIKLGKTWPMYPGGYMASGLVSKRYGVVPGTRVPLTITYNQSKKNKNLNIINNIKNLEVGETYLFVIEVTRNGKFITKFLKTDSGRIEFTTRHAFLANINKPSQKVVIAAGEIRRSLVGYRFNLESGTFMPALRNWYTTLGGNYKNYPTFVKEVMNIPNANYTTNILTNTRNVLTPQQITNRANKCAGLEVFGYKSTKKQSGVPKLTYKECVNSFAERITRSKGPVNPKMSIKYI